MNIPNASTTYKSHPPYSPEERSKTPKSFKTNAFKSNTRESKSLIKNDHRVQGFINLPSRMEPIKQWQLSNRYYFLGKGNNHEAVRRALSQRKGLIQSNQSEGIFFKWTQNSFGFKYHKLGKDCLSFNHFEFHREITNKQRLCWNMINFCESNKLNAFSYIPTTFIVDLTTGEEDLAVHSFIKFYNRNIPEGYTGAKVQSILLPRSKYTPFLSAQQLHKKSMGNFYCKPTCPKTFFSQSNSYLWILKPTFMNRGRGVTLFSNLSQFQKLVWKYYEGEGLEDYQNKEGLGQLYKISEHSQNTIHIITEDAESIKQHTPSTFQSQKLIQKAQPPFNQKTQPPSNQKPNENQIQSQSKKYEGLKNDNLKNYGIKNEDAKNDGGKNYGVKNEDAKNDGGKNENGGKASMLRCSSFIVQKYIQCPMLVNERKFDIRVWALLTQNYEVFFFRQGYLRFSSHKYTTNDHKNPFIHLTNNSVQKHCNQYNEQSGNQISLSDLKEYIPNESIYAKIQMKIREIIWISMCAARRKINVNARKDCFELFGYDFMIDEAYKVWLIEINTNPAIEECSSVLKMLIPRMLDDMFKLTLDKIFNLKRLDDGESYAVKGFLEGENMWQLVGDFRQGINQKSMGKRMSLIRR